MKTLYESILDKEDELISKSVEYSNNPFHLLSQYIIGDKQLEYNFKSKILIKEIFVNYIIPKFPEHLKNIIKFKFYGDNIALNVSSEYDNFISDLLVISPNIFVDVDSVQTNKFDKIAVIFLDPIIPSDKKDLNKKYNFTKAEYEKFIKKLAKEFKLNPSKKDKYIYSI